LASGYAHALILFSVVIVIFALRLVFWKLHYQEAFISRLFGNSLRPILPHIPINGTQ